MMRMQVREGACRDCSELPDLSAAIYHRLLTIYFGIGDPEARN